jgi:DNA-binding CsgD family transcriptional regulator
MTAMFVAERCQRGQNVDVWRVNGVRACITPRQKEALSLTLRYGRREAAHRMDISPDGVKMLLSRLYASLDVGSMFDAACALGWLEVPA